MSQTPTPIRRGDAARDTEAFAKQIAANLLETGNQQAPAPAPDAKAPDPESPDGSWLPEEQDHT